MKVAGRSPTTATPPGVKPFTFLPYVREMHAEDAARDLFYVDTNGNSNSAGPSSSSSNPRKRKAIVIDEDGIEIISSGSDSDSDVEVIEDGKMLLNHVIGPNYVTPPRNNRSAVQGTGFQHARMGLSAAESGHKSVGTPPWVQRKYVGSLEKRLHDEIEDFVSYIAPTPEEEITRQAVVNRYSEVIRSAKEQKWQINGRTPGKETVPARIGVFGSFGTGLYLPDGDLDLVLLDPDGREDPEKGAMASGLSKYHRYLRPLGSSSMLIKHAKIPIIKMRDRETGLQVDISYNQQGGLRGVDTIKALLAQLSDLRPLCFVIKHFLYLRALNDNSRSGVGGYALVLWIAAFLKLHPSIFPNRYPTNTAESPGLGALLLDFFQLFGYDFDYHTNGLAVNSAREAAHIYQKNQHSWRRTPDRGKDYLLSLEDPNDALNDVSQGAGRIQEITTLLASAKELIRHAPQNAQTLLGLFLNVPEKMQRFRSAFRVGRGGEEYAA
ncbi:hypothetical protein HK097_008546, partial [Rhizophlyctis rosea]